jgi:hypothetical protein
MTEKPANVDPGSTVGGVVGVSLGAASPENSITSACNALFRASSAARRVNLDETAYYR